MQVFFQAQDQLRRSLHRDELLAVRPFLPVAGVGLFGLHRNLVAVFPINREYKTGFSSTVSQQNAQ